jgi:ribose-phosphate pyrophosphokinase
MDLHAAQIQGFFDVPVDHLYAAPVLNDYFRKMNLSGDDIVIVSPDEGSIKRAIGHVKRLGGKLAIVDKRRANAMETIQENIIGGPIEGRVALMFDDMISTAGSICGAASLVHDAGAREIHVAATHGVFCGPAIERIQQAPITSMVVTDSIPIDEENMIPQIKVLTVATLLAEAIKRIHHDQSISAIFANLSETD